MSTAPDEPSPNPYEAPESTSHSVPASARGDATGGIIPYQNPPALIAYYLGLFSLLPCLGFFLAVPALVLGLMGLEKRRQNPEVKGAVHAWIGVVMGGLFTLVWGGLLILAISGWWAARNG